MKHRFRNHLSKTKKIFIRIIVSLLFFYYLLPYAIPLGLKDLPHSHIVVDTHGEEIGEIVKDKTYRHISLSYEEFPAFLKTIVVAVEDKRFWNHEGIDWFALARAFRNNRNEKKVVEGGSTISAQLVRNTYRLNSPRTVWKKLAEFYLARILNKHHSKEKILTQYLNTIAFGYLNYGFESASRYFFGKPLAQLTKAEMIALLVIPKNPGLYDPYKQQNAFIERYGILLEYLHYNRIISEDEYQQIKEEKLIFLTTHENKLPYIVDLIQRPQIASSLAMTAASGKQMADLEQIQGQTSQKIVTTIDYNLSKKIYDYAYETIMKLMWKNVGDFGVLVIDKETGEVKVLLGGMNYRSSNGQVNSVFALNQAGSAIKPFTYLLAFQNLGLGPNDTILDLPVQFKTQQGYGYTPKNYSLDYKGEVTLAEALSQSLNVPAVKVAEKVGTQNLLDFLKKVGISSLNQSADYYGLALTLGVGEVSLRELTRAYGIFAQEGKLCDITLFSGQAKSCTQVANKKNIDDVLSILSNRYFKLQEFPMYSNLDFPDRFVFLKSGTSRNFSDSRVLGFTDHYLIGVWMGNKDGSAMKGVCGACGAGDLFNKIVYDLETKDYIPQAVNLNANKQNYVTITSPLDKTVLKYVPSLPNNVQNVKLDFSSNIDYDFVQWTLNGKFFSGQFWNIRPGKFTLRIGVFKDGKEVGSDEARIEIQEE